MVPVLSRQAAWRVSPDTPGSERPRRSQRRSLSFWRPPPHSEPEFGAASNRIHSARTPPTWAPHAPTPHDASAATAKLGSLLHCIVADGPPAENQIAFFIATRGLTFRRIVRVQMCCAIVDGILHAHMALQSLVQTSCLSDVDRDPTSILALAGVDKVSGQWAKSSIQRENLVLILLSGLTGPNNAKGRRTLRCLAVTE